MNIIGLSGYARSGKDEAAKILAEEYGYKRVAFADKLREVLYALNPAVSIEFSNYGGEMYHRESMTVRYVQDIIDEYGWDGYKKTMFATEIRRLIQRLGTEAGRETLWDSIWVDAAFAGIPEDARVVITDVRFENEAQAVAERGGRLVRVTRKGVGPAVDDKGVAHKSETSLDDWDFDYHLNNAYSLEQYHEDVRWLVEREW